MYWQGGQAVYRPAGEREVPEAFASGVCALRKRFGLPVLGGCCGTDGRHLAALARGMMLAGVTPTRPPSARASGSSRTFSASFTTRHETIAEANVVSTYRHGSDISPGRPTNVRTVPRGISQSSTGSCGWSGEATRGDPFRTVQPQFLVATVLASRPQTEEERPASEFVRKDHCLVVAV
jgi:hypothetical protein